MNLSANTFNTCESQSQDQDSPVPELSATAITFNTCESQSWDQDSPVPELSVTTIANRLVLYPCHRTDKYQKPHVLVAKLFTIFTYKDLLRV